MDWFIIGLVVLVVKGMYWLTPANQVEGHITDCPYQYIADDALGGPLTLLNTDGQTITEAEIFTKPTLLYFGYTSCPDVCPMDNARNAEAVDILEQVGLDVQPAFISVDPTRDTPEAVRGFTSNLHPKMIGLTGTEEQVKAATNTYHVYAKKQDTADEHYLVDHSTYTYLVLPDVGLVGFFERDATAHEVAKEAACLIRASKN